MPMYFTHMLIAKKYIEKNKGLPGEIKNIQKFIDANILPDLAPDKAKSHYGNRTEKFDIVKRNIEKVDPEKFKIAHDLSDETNLGQYMHLLVDYNYYNVFLKDYFFKNSFEQADKDMFEVSFRDYKYIREKYGVSSKDSTFDAELVKRIEDWKVQHYNKWGRIYKYTYPYTIENLEKFIDEMASVKI